MKSTKNSFLYLLILCIASAFNTIQAQSLKMHKPLNQGMQTYYSGLKVSSDLALHYKLKTKTTNDAAREVIAFLALDRNSQNSYLKIVVKKAVKLTAIKREEMNSIIKMNQLLTNGKTANLAVEIKKFGALTDKSICAQAAYDAMNTYASTQGYNDINQMINGLDIPDIIDPSTLIPNFDFAQSIGYDFAGSMPAFSADDLKNCKFSGIGVSSATDSGSADEDDEGYGYQEALVALSGATGAAIGATIGGTVAGIAAIPAGAATFGAAEVGAVTGGAGVGAAVGGAFGTALGLSLAAVYNHATSNFIDPCAPHYPENCVPGLNF